MGQIKNPGGGGSVTPQTEGGDHPRGTGAKNHDHKQKTERESQQPADREERDGDGPGR